jgi:hypothetical protein
LVLVVLVVLASASRLRLVSCERSWKAAAPMGRTVRAVVRVVLHI